MKPSERIRHHLQSHVVAYLALFVALSGTALALPGKNKVKSNDIARSAVKGKAIADRAVGKAKLRDGAVSSSKLGAGAVISAALADGAVTAPKLAEDSVTRGKIVQGSINGGKIANGAIDSAKVDDGSLLGEDFAPGQLSDGFATRGSLSRSDRPRSTQRFTTVRRAGCSSPRRCSRRVRRRTRRRATTVTSSRCTDVQVPGTLNDRSLPAGDVRAADPDRALRSGSPPALSHDLARREVDGDATEAQRRRFGRSR